MSKSRRIVTESSLVAKLFEEFNSRGYKCHSEIPNMGQSADFVAIYGRKIVIVEAKVGDWRRAVRQSKAHGLVGDYVLIAIVCKKVPSQLRAVADETGLGVIMLDPLEGLLTLEIMPKRSRSVWPPQRRIFQSHLEEVVIGN